MEEKPDQGTVRTTPVDERETHRRRSDNGEAAAHAVDPGGRKGFDGSSVGDVEHGGEGGVVNVLDVLVKGSPPPTTGEPSPGRNHAVADSRGRGFEEDGGRTRVVLVDSLAKGSKPPCPGESSKRRNSVSEGVTVSDSLQSPGHGVSGCGGGDSEERTTSTSRSHGSNPNNEGQ